MSSENNLEKNEIVSEDQPPATSNQNTKDNAQNRLSCNNSELAVSEDREENVSEIIIQQNINIVSTDSEEKFAPKVSRTTTLQDQDASMIIGCNNVESVDKLDVLLVANDDEKVEESLVEKVSHLDISPPKCEALSSSSKNTGTVVQNKLSESLNFLKAYSSDDESTESEDDIVFPGLKIGDNEDDESEDSEQDTEDYDSDDIFVECSTPSETNSKASSKESQKGNASWIADLVVNETASKIPDISSLELNNKEEFLHVGNIDCVLDKFVTIESLPAMPAYDLDTLFFIDEGQKVLGYVFDVMGPVSTPIYVIHMDSLETVQNLQLKRGTKIYCAPKSKYTKYVFLHELMKIRGSDASWVGDTEVPPEFQEFSDDEEERTRKSLKNQPAKRKHSLERHQKFESNMNKINQLNSRLHNILDARNPLRRRINEGAGRPDRAPPATAPPPNNEDPSRRNNLEAYFQNCTSQFLQHWRGGGGNVPPPNAVAPPELSPPYRYATPPPNYPQQRSFCSPPPPMQHFPGGGGGGGFVPPEFLFDPSMPPPNYAPGGDFSTQQQPPQHLGAISRNRGQQGGNFRQSFRPGPSSNNGC